MSLSSSMLNLFWTWGWSGYIRFFEYWGLVLGTCVSSIGLSSIVYRVLCIVLSIVYIEYRVSSIVYRVLCIEYWGLVSCRNG